MGKRGFEFSFAWIFSIIVGAVVIFLAIYSVSRFVATEREVRDTEIGKEIGILLNPVETNLESLKIIKIELPDETRLFNECSEQGNFGSQKISVSTKSGIGKEWQNAGIASSFSNRYLFSKSIVQGEEYFALSKPLKMPYKTADIILLWSGDEKYCFVDAPDKIEEELGETNMNTGLNFSDAESECEKGSIKVCFLNTNCEINVDLNAKSVKKGNKKVYYAETDDDEYSLLYGAIFSDLDVYECHIRRIMKRTSELASLYAEKGLYLSGKGCGSNLESDLGMFAQKCISLNNSIQLGEIENMASEIGRRNGLLSCKLF